MKKYGFQAAVFAVALGAFTACSDDDNQPIEPPVSKFSNGAYVLNTGNYGQNNASIQWYNKETGEVSKDLFETANERGIGDAQDMCVYGSKIYITSSTSAKIEVVNKEDFKVIKTLPLKNAQNQPIDARYLTAAGGNVFFTAYDGTVSRLDTLSLEITKTLPVGDHPEGITNAKGKLYINVSGYGSGKTVAVVDIASFTKLKDIEVKLNPNTECITGADGNVYMVSNGNYAGSSHVPEDKWIYQTLQCIDPVTDAVKELCNATYIANKGDKMYILYAEYYLPKTHSISVYDLKKNELKPFIDIKEVPNPSFIKVDPVSGDVYIGSMVKDANNEIYIYSEKGEFKKKIEAGYYTTAVYFPAQ